jgi:hypothetical protein
VCHRLLTRARSPVVQVAIYFGSWSGALKAEIFNSFVTLKLHGRLSANLLEDALLAAADGDTYASAGALPRAYEVWIRSLPPRQRSTYTARLVKAKFAGAEWGGPEAPVPGERLTAAQRPAVAAPLGDNWHSAAAGTAVAAAAAWFALLNHCTMRRTDKIEQ